MQTVYLKVQIPDHFIVSDHKIDVTISSPIGDIFGTDAENVTEKVEGLQTAAAANDKFYQEQVSERG